MSTLELHGERAATEEGVAAGTRQARIAGLLYLAVIFGGIFAEGVVRAATIVVGDAAATAEAIAADETLWRSGLIVHLLYLCAGVVVNVVLYGLFKAVQPVLARLALIFSMTGLAVEAVSLVQLYVPLALIEDETALTRLNDDQKDALGYLAVSLFSTGWSFALFFFAGFCISIGVLILRSRLIPRFIGPMMILAGSCYLTNSLVLILSPQLSERIVPWILLPCFLGELTLALWLLVKGVRLGPAARMRTGVDSVAAASPPPRDASDAASSESADVLRSAR